MARPRRESLHHLLLELFADGGRLDAFLAANVGFSFIKGHLPPLFAGGFDYYALMVVEVLERHGALDSRFFDALADAYPNRQADIDAVRRQYHRSTNVSFAVEKGPTRGPAQDDDDRPTDHIVSTGFAAAATPALPLDPDRTLRTDTPYYFWLAVGAAVPDSIERTRTTLPVDLLPRDARLDVLLFTNEGGLLLANPDETRGALLLALDGTVHVTRPASRPPGMRVRGAFMRRRLLFAVRTPPQPGIYQLRCGIYCKRVLVQSRDVQVTVAAEPVDLRGALASRLDYTLTRSLSPTTFAALGEHRLSLMVNDSPASHGFRFCAGDGAGELHGSANLDIGTIQDLVDSARKAYREVSWDPDPLDPAVLRYRYQQPGTYDRLRTDLVTLARRGYAMYVEIARKLAGGHAARDRLHDLMTHPGQIQLALQSSARLVLPLALFYDHPLDTQRPPAAYRLCDAYLLAHRDDRVADSDCLRGRCPSRGQLDVVCPGGFWGFRHAIGMPVTLGDADGTPTEAAAAIVVDGSAKVLLIRSQDPKLEQAGPHIQQLRDLVGQAHCDVAETRTDALRELARKERHLVYFYCHGGVDHDNRPLLHVGLPDDLPIAPDSLHAFGVRWDFPRPLVILNGCHTVDVEPRRAIDLVGTFMDDAGAAGVVGTEITVFEPLATAFARLVLPAFLQGVPLGEAIRRARVDLLVREHNPLGLVYIPFALSSLALVQARA